MKKIMDNVSFTKNETKVILFIVAVLITGFSVKYYKHIIRGGDDSSFNYNSSDSEFISLSGNINKINNTGIPNGNHNVNGDSLRESNAGNEAVININTASKQQFIDLPGIGESIADKIIAYRTEKKGFKKIEDLMSVSGIGKKKFDKIRNYIKAE